ncbi:lytic transglycosylase domain-containing protein [Halomonas piscis]|uniref:Lytic transglycosylase domain-containing protein n=1 Tax=Halomonas piscis TaxID=3031727 RepID=A0ABY9YXI3_9GAMM|nr:lytic transglycosylase domain-containing protein [Halomonas piscis]WNK18763.1 lytic transglycosylase domain-containing protein [Halomonas piscis]
MRRRHSQRRRRSLAKRLSGALCAVALLGAAAFAEVQPTFDAARPDARQQKAQRRFHDAMDARLARFMGDAAARKTLLTRLYREARLAGLPPSLVLALIEVESAFRPEAVSSAGAVGLMQIMPFWIEELGLAADDLKAPERNLRYGCTILAYYLARENGDFTRALARYNGSLSHTRYPERVLDTWQSRWRLTPPP